MPSFEFATSNRIVFGAGKLSGLGDSLQGRAKRLLLVRGRSSDAIPRVREILFEQEISFDEFEVHGEPTVDVAREGARAAEGCDLVIGLGGGSVLDAGKAIAALATNRNDVLDYLEVVGKGQPLTEKPLTFIAIPTTAGTGTEVTRNAVLDVPEHGVKVSLRSPMMLPSLAIVDPELTYSLSPEITAASGLDALTQLIEPFVSVKANPLTDAICREGMRHAAGSLRKAYQDGMDKEAREGMALASLFGGLALANAVLGAVHGFAGPLGGMLHAPHGAICAKLLPLVMEANIKEMAYLHIGHDALDRYAEIAHILSGDVNASAWDGVRWVEALVSELKIPPLSAHGMTESHIPDAVQKTLNASSYKGNPIALGEGELRGILEKAL
ncbi:MAG TPA: iron-containing alcohol dehydrogenase [Anaerolineales bacterium]|nr:iron-containing alcohol dehydrogenase [Anaerolineales bacterium]HNO30687.1 iron-containing alcohol dehydrogenase [Anaerolineales bacterium]